MRAVCQRLLDICCLRRSGNKKEIGGHGRCPPLAGKGLGQRAVEFWRVDDADVCRRDQRQRSRGFRRRDQRQRSGFGDCAGGSCHTDINAIKQFVLPRFDRPVELAESVLFARLTKVEIGRQDQRLPLTLDAQGSYLVTGGLAAAIVVAEQVVTALTDGHLLLAWVAMWLIVFGLLATFSDAIRTWPTQWQAQLAARRQAVTQRMEDERTWAVAQTDPRLMAELDSALLRAQRDALANGQEMPYWPFADMPSTKAMPMRWA